MDRVIIEIENRFEKTNFILHDNTLLWPKPLSRALYFTKMLAGKYFEWHCSLQPIILHH